jgi:hypothetical protein
MKPSAEGDPSTINGKRAWDVLCSALVDLGQPIEVPRLSAMSSSEHREYLDLVARYDRADVTAVRDIFVEAGAGKVRSFFWCVFFKIPTRPLGRTSEVRFLCLEARRGDA